MTPNDRKYAKTHEWIKIEGSLAVIGISNHAQAALGDITYVEPFTVGRKVAKGAECGVIESVKAASDIYAPVGGEVVETNTALKNVPEEINRDPYGKGWILKLKNFNPSDMGDLMSAEDYEKTNREQK